MEWIKSPYTNMIERQKSFVGSTYDIPNYTENDNLPEIANLQLLAKEVIQSLTRSNIVIYGDYDVDGIMSSGILYKALIFLSNMAENITGYEASKIELLIPDRFQNGYGFQPASAEKIKNSIVILVDNGITANDAVALANENGNRVFVLDHHEPGRILPPAEIIVDPHAIKGEFDVYCAAGLAYRLVREMINDAVFQDYIPEDTKKQALTEFLYMAAVATVADVVPLLWENRPIVKEGLKQIPPYWKAVTETLLGQDKKDTLHETDVSFKIAPAINAAGRLGELTSDMVKSLVTDRNEAKKIADELVYLNTIRKSEKSKALKEVSDKVPNLPVCVIQSENVHAGVVGIVAGQLSDKEHKPVFVFGPVADGNLTGSARAPKDTVHLKKLLDEVNEKKPGLLLKWGGHESAAGVTIREEDLHEFEDLVNELGKYDPSEQKAVYDFVLTNENWLDVYNGLHSFGPFGEGNPPPVLMFECTPGPQDVSMIGKGETVKIRVGLNELIGFGMGKTFPHAKTLRCFGTLEVNDFRGGKQLQLNLRDIVPIENQFQGILKTKIAI